MECKICRAPDAGNHHSQNCCRACAAFFRRTISLKLRYRCKKIGNCKINKDTRFFCRYCRMKKCINAGMTNPEDPYASMDFYLDTSASVVSIFNLEGEETLPSLNEEDDFYSPEMIFNKNDEFVSKFKGRLQDILEQDFKTERYPFKLTLHQQAMAAFTTHRLKWPIFKDKVSTAKVIDVNDDFCACFKAIQYSAEFLMDIPEFARLPLVQKSYIMDRFVSPFMYFERMFKTVDVLGNNVEDTRSIYYNGQVADIRETAIDASKISNCSSEELKSMFYGEEDLYVAALCAFKKLNPDQFEFMYMLLFCLWDLEGRDGIADDTLHLAAEMRDRLAEELFFYYKFEKKVGNFASRIYKMHNLFSAIDRMDELWEENSQLAKAFTLFHFDVRFDNLKEQTPVR